MLLNQPPDDIVNSWQQTSDRALEAGEPLQLILGAPDGNLQSLAGLYAYEVFKARRKTGQPSQMLIGGAGPAWLLALLQSPPRNRNALPLPSASGNVGYIGATPGMAMAATTIYDLTSAASSRRLMPPPGEIPIGWQDQLLPESRPAQPVRWSAFPLAQAIPPLDVDATSTEPNWSAVVALLLAAVLIILAVLL